MLIIRWTLPQANNKTIKNIESVTDVLDESICCQFEDHLHCEDAAEDQIADLHHPGEGLWLVMILYPHTEGVYEDAKENSLLENTVVHTKVQASSDSSKEITDSFHTGRKTSENQEH